MKTHFSKSDRRLQTKALALLAGLLLSPLAVMAADSIYINTGTINNNNLPTVDATNFYNSGTWYIYTSPSPYHTSDTLNYTNEGTMMYSEVGWDFALWPSIAGQRGMSASFFNDSPGTIQAASGLIRNPSYTLTNQWVGYLLISATNIVNKGTLIGDGHGEVQLTGSYVDLTRSHLTVNAITRVGSTNITGTNFLSDIAIYDEYWGQTNTLLNGTTPYTIDSSAIWNGTSFASPTFYVNELCARTNDSYTIPMHGRLTVTSIPSLSDSTTNVAATTNLSYINVHGITNQTGPLPIHIFKQAVFVYVTDPNITASNRFLSTGALTNLFQTVTVRLTDLASGEVLYLQDTLASSTNRGVLNNVNYISGSNPKSSCSDPSYRPANYNLGGADPQAFLANGLVVNGSFANGSPGVGKPANNFLYDSTNFINPIVPAIYAGYSAYIDNLVGTNGGIIINAGTLNLNRTTIAASGAAEVVIQANNLTNAPTLVSCQNLSYNLGSTNGYLNITNLAQQNVSRFRGTIDAWSALWTNTMTQIVATNHDTNAGTSTPVTNSTEMDFHVLLVDASALSSMVPVTVQDLILNSTNMVVSDPMTVVRTLLFNGQSLTLLTNLTLSGVLQDWTYTNAPNLRYFTNNGDLYIPNNAHFGDDGPTNYAAFVNNGRITSGGGATTINSDYFQNSGNLYAAGGVFVTTSTGLVANASTPASITSGQDMDFTGGALELTNAIINVGNHLNFNMTNKLYDAGPSSGNNIICNNGFSLLSKPTNGDFLGTTINDVVTNEAEVDHVWAGADRGTNAAGFSNNVAIGYLELDDNGAPFGEPLFAFGGTSTNAGITNGLYVTNLDVSGLSDPAYENEIQIAPNLNIYYITSFPPGAAAYLNSHSFGGGHFIQVTNVTPSGYLPNILSLGLSVPGSGQQFQLTVNGVADQTYVLQASTDLVNWVNICTGTPPFIDPNASNYPTRFYRIMTPP